MNLGGFSNVSLSKWQPNSFDISMPVNTVLNFYANQLDWIMMIRAREEQEPAITPC
jgi:hypothetical protein